MQTKHLTPQEPSAQLLPAQQARPLALFFHPLGAVLFHGLPQLLLVGIWGWMLYAQHTFLTPHARPYFYIAFGIMTAMWLGHLAYSLYCLRQGKALSVGWIYLSLPLYVLALVTYYLKLDDFTTFGVPSWQEPTDILHYTGSFIVPAILHQLSLLALRLQHRQASNSGWRSLLMALLPPLICYLMIVAVFSLRLPVELENYWLVLFLTCATVVSVFYLILGGIRLSHRSIGSTSRSILLGLLTAVLPLICLMVNNGSLWGDVSGDRGMFGDFNHPLFYGLALLNGLLISLPSPKSGLRRWLFLGRCMLLPYSLYFFVVMAPFMPFSVFLAILLGLGLLLLVPVAVLGFHLKALWEDIGALRATHAPATLLIAGAIASMALPMSIYLTYQHDRVVLHQALNYLEDPTATMANPSTFTLRRTLSHIQGNKSRNNRWFDSRHSPLLTPWFTWQVLDGLSLSDSKVNEIKRVFLGESLQQENIPFSRWGRPESGAVSISALSGSSRYDAAAGHWISEVAIDMHNSSEGWQEYITRFDLPPGCFVSDYYLFIGERKEPGLLVEKKAATWVYDQITSQRQDPGLLRYLDNGLLELRVYPFVGLESRRTGFTLLHKRPFVLQLDDKELPLGDPENAPTPQLAQNGAGMYLPVEVKKRLPLLERKGYWHIIIDASKGKKGLQKTYQQAVNRLLKEHPELARQAKVSFVNHSVATYSLGNIDLAQQWEQQDFEGGFYLERALQSLYASHVQSGEQAYPIPLILTDTYEEAILPPTLLQYSFAFPQHEQFYQLEEWGGLRAYTLAYPRQEAPTLIAPAAHISARAWPDAENTRLYLPDNEEDVLVPFLTAEGEPQPGSSDWDKGLALWSNWQAAQLYPGQQPWREQVQASFAARILSPYTAFMVVEEEWQKELLLRKQQQYLNGHPGLDSGSELQEMPEPEFWALLLLFMGWLAWRKRKGLQAFISPAASA
jgi:hypothetical protein